jgi:GDP-4-dehydro-6-deoxy-D-mannose reductase
MTSLITGVCGFAGRHLAEHLLQSDEHVFGTYLEHADTKNLGPLSQRVGLLQADVRNPHKMGMILRKTRPDTIYHLAAQASVAVSFQKPVATVDTNVTGTVGLLEAVKREAPESRVLFPSTSDVYGKVRRRDVPLRETHPVAPANPYAASKLAAEEICRQYERSFGLHIIIVRSFNHTGPGQGMGFVVPDFASQIARLERKRGVRQLKVGNLSAERDISDVRDIVRGYRLLARKAEPGQVYHLARGKAYRIREILGMLLGMAEKEIRIVSDPGRQRPSDLPILAGNAAKAKRATGWKAVIPIERTLEDCLNYWRSYGNED